MEKNTVKNYSNNILVIVHLIAFIISLLFTFGIYKNSGGAILILVLFLDLCIGFLCGYTKYKLSSKLPISIILGAVSLFFVGGVLINLYLIICLLQEKPAKTGT
jgi:hypothetical protein